MVQYHQNLWLSFRGIPLKSIDKDGNLTMGIKEQIIFPDISAESAKNIFGLEICMVVKSKSRKQAIALYNQLGFPLQHG